MSPIRTCTAPRPEAASTDCLEVPANLPGVIRLAGEVGSGPMVPPGLDEHGATPELLSAILDQMPAVFAADCEGRPTFVNPAARRLFTSAEGECRLPAGLPAIIRRIADNGKEIHDRISFGQGPRETWSVRYAGIWNPTGQLIGILGQLQTEIASLEHRLSAAEERLNDISRLASDWIWETDTELALTYVSPRVSEALGYQPIELIGRSFLDIGSFIGDPPLDPDCRVPFRDRSFTMLHRDGSLRRFQVSALPVFCLVTGAFLGFRGMARDVTAQFEAANRAAESQRQLTQALDSISEGFALFDPDDRLVLCNHKFRETYPNATPPIIPGMSYRSLLDAVIAGGDLGIAEEDAPEWIVERLRLRSEGRVSLETKLADGRWVKINDYRTADGSIVGIRTDITALKNREEALFLAKETAEVASRTKTDFLANVSHELRTPLNAIIGFSEIMRGEIFGPLGSPQYTEYVGDVLDSAHHLLGVINDILDVAKAEAGKLELIEEEFEIPTLVRSALRLVHERALSNGLTIEYNIPENLPLVCADERKLKQVLLNLLTNAVKFTPKGGRLLIGSHLADNGDLILSVADTGIGIATQDIATALAPFGQVDSKLSRRYEGTGLGLPLSNALMRLHGGDLAIESEVGHGTTVRLRLPSGRLRQA